MSTTDVRTAEEQEGESSGRHFIVAEVESDLAAGKVKQVVTRFPPEPNGYLHIGHAKAICLNFGLAQDFGGRCHLRFDDTNPSKEEKEFVEAIERDVHWLGFDWGSHLYHASDYFEKLYSYALDLIKAGKAFVCDLTPDQVREYRGTLTEPGRPSPHRERTVEENLDLFERMKNGEFEDGSRTLRAKIDMASPNINLRDPALYRIRKVSHHRAGDRWCIYPLYDWTHGISDALEHVSHSLCSLEFENHRPLYDWILEQLEVPCHPRQIEFSRLNITYTVMSKRKLTHLVTSGMVKGWDDPRMPTLAAYRRRGYTPEAIREFCRRAGVSRSDQWIDPSQLDECLREDLNTKTKRVMGILDPLKVVIENYPEDGVELMPAPFYPDDPPLMGDRELPFCRELYIDRSDFMEDPPKKYFRLAPGSEVRLRRAYYITCTGVVKDGSGRIVELRAKYDPQSRGGTTPDNRRVKGTIHWVSARHALDAEVRLYDRLFTVERPDAVKDRDWLELVNPDSLVVKQAKVEPSLAEARELDRFQFERVGFFAIDKDSRPGALVFNRIVTLKDGWSKMMAKSGGQ
jgi:glutaminyl-tRNA synthetase